MTERTVPAAWTRLSAQDLSGTLMIIGAPDTGKSTLAGYLCRDLCRAGRRVAYLDTDVGQSSLGLPTTMTVALSAGEDRWPPRGPRSVYFVGSTTPRGHMLPLVVGAHRLRQKALALGAESIVVDTTGLVDPAQGGKALKQWKIELLAPQVVIALQRERELEPILGPLRRDERLRCIELDASPYAVGRSREARIARRQERLSRYFAPAGSLRVPVGRMAVFDRGFLVPGALLALQDLEGFALGLGVVETIDRRVGTVDVRTPLPGLESVASVRVGALRWDLDRCCECG